MPLFDQDSMSKLSMCHAEMQVLMYEVVRHMECNIVDIDQEKKPPIKITVAPVPQSDHIYEECIYMGGFVKGIAARLLADGKMTYGVNFGHTTDNLCHFELVTS